MLSLCVLLFWTSQAPGNDRSLANHDGHIVEQRACAPWEETYAQFIEQYEDSYVREVRAARQHGITMQPFAALRPHLPTEAAYERMRAYTGFECQRIRYLSDGLQVVGYIWKPQETQGKKLPLIIFNRGGSRAFGKLTPCWRFGFYHFLTNGFVVLGSQYRGNDGSEGHEEFGGNEVHDVLNLIPLARSLAYVDSNNLFMLGESRGGMMTYLALKHQMPVNAAAVVGALADVEASLEQRPELVRAWQGLIPHFEIDRVHRLRARSAMRWAEAINTPVLILHGGADWRVETKSQAFCWRNGCKNWGRCTSSSFMPGTTTVLSFNLEDSERRIVAWFQRHMK
jgi:dipeptidyl aminopeptidase/acylaminoacyl peptidase